MSTVVDARVPAEEFALATSLAENPAARFEVGRALANTTENVTPFLWVSGGDPDSLCASLEADPTTEDIELMGQFDDECLFDVEWTGQVHHLFNAFLSPDQSALLDASSSGDEWCFRLVYPGTDCVETVEDTCRDLGVGLDVERVYSLSEAFTRDHFQLTEKQYETILAAYEAGYYDVPRKITLKQLADELDVSHQALSERLRRGHGVLMANSLGLGFDESSIADADSQDRVQRPPLVQSDQE